MLKSIMSIRDWLEQVRNHAGDQRWLAETEESLHEVIKLGLRRNHEFHDAVELLMAVVPHYALVLYHPQKWSPLLYDALVQAQDLRDNEMQIRILTQLGETDMTAGKNPTARASFSIALERARDGQIREMMLAAYTGLIRMLSVNIPDDFTTELFEKALTLSDEVEDLSLRAALHQSLTLPYTYARQSTKAVEHAQIAYIYWRHLKNDIEMAKTLYLLAAAYRFAWKLERAEKVLEIAAITFVATNYNRQYPLVGYEEGALYLQRKEYDMAEQALKIALQEAIEIGSSYLIASCQHALAIAQTGLGEYKAAVENLRQVFTLWEDLGDDYEFASAHQAMGNLENIRGNHKSAYKWLQTALSLCERLPLDGQRDWLINHIQATIEEIPGEYRL